MQMQKMLNVLILLFLMINIGLFFYLAYEEESTYTLTNERKEQVQAILELNDIKISAGMLTEFYPKAMLVVTEPDEMNYDSVALFFDDNVAPVGKFSDEEYRYSDPQGVDAAVLRINRQTEKGRITYTDSDDNLPYVSEDFTSIIKNQEIAKAFVDDFTTGDGVFEVTDQKENTDKGYYFFFYNERFEDELLFCNEVRLRIEKKGISEAVGIRYNPSYFLEEKMAIFPPDEMLYKFMIFVRDEGLKNVEITAMDLGYHIGPDGLHDLRSVEIEPYYRIKISAGQTYYINAFTNEMSVY